MVFHGMPRFALVLSVLGMGNGASLKNISSSEAYDEDLAIDLARYSAVAICRPDQVASWTLSSSCSAELSSFQVVNTYVVDGGGPFSNNVGFAYLGIDTARELVIASFKGSNDTMDWIHDIEGGEFDFSSCALRSGDSVGTVHSGFCAYYQGIAALGVAEDFVTLARSYPSYTAVSTGHSLGATAAALLAFDAYGLSTGSVAPALYTYGMPRTGDHEFAVELGTRASPSFRLTHWKDTVPHLPLVCPFAVTLSGCPYHTATEIFYVEDSSSYTVCDGSGEDSSCSYQFPVVVTDGNDHCSYFEGTIGSICGDCCA